MCARNFAMRETSLKMHNSTPLRSLAIMHAFTIVLAHVDTPGRKRIVLVLFYHHARYVSEGLVAIFTVELAQSLNSDL